MNFADITQQVPPSNIDAEESVLGAVLLDPEAIGRIADFLPVAAFTIASYRDIYRTAIALYQEQKPTDLLTLMSKLRDTDLLEKVGGQHKLLNLLSGCVSAVNVENVARLIFDKYQSRRLIDAGMQITQMGYDQAVPVDLRVDAAEQKIFALSQGNTESEPELVAQTCIKIFDEIQRFETEGHKPGLETGFYELNKVTDGGLMSGLVLVAARPSMGKSAFAAQLAFDMAEKHKMPALIFSLEMSAEQISDRFLSATSSVGMSKLTSRQLAPEDMMKLIQALERVSSVPIAVDDSASPSVPSIRSKVRRMIAKHGKLCAVVIDYLQLMVSGGDEANEVRQIGQITRQLKLLSRECDVPIILLSQLNRSVEGRTNKRPCLADLRGSGRIEEDADVVMMLYRDDYYNTTTQDRGICEVSIVKQRNGPTGVFKLIFDGSHCRFLNMA